MTSSRRFLAAASLLLFVALAGCHAVEPVEEPVCHTCETGVEGVDDANVTADSSSLRIDLRADGSGRFTVESDLSGEGVERLRSNETAVERLAERAVATTPYRDGVRNRPVHRGNVSNLTANFENGTLTVGFTVPDAARQAHGGTLLVDYLHTRGEHPPDHRLGAERVVVSGPPGTVVTNDPPGGRVTDDGTAVVWTGSETRVSSHTYVTYGADGGSSGRVAGQAAIALDVAGWAGPEVAERGAVPAAAFALLFGLLWALLYRYDDALESPLRRGAGGDGSQRYPGVGRDVAVGGTLLLGGVAVTLAAYGTPLLDAVMRLPVVLAGWAVLFLVAGAAVHRSRRTTRVATMLLVGSPFVIEAASVTEIPDTPAEPVTFLSVLLLVVPWLLVSPAFLVGWYAERSRSRTT